MKQTFKFTSRSFVMPLVITISITASLMALSSCSSSGAKPNGANSDAVLNDPEVAERGRKLQTEMALGKEMASRVAGHFKVHAPKNKELVTYLNTLAQALGRKAGRPEITYTVEILDDDKPNAYATPGGYLFVTKGLLAFVTSEEELAGVLGHEIGHVNDRHVMSKVLKSDTSAVGTLSHIVGGGRASMGGSINQAAIEGLNLILDTGYGPELEVEADKFGAMLIASAGYSPKPYYDLLVRMSRLQPGKELSKTHPPFKARLNDLRKFYVQEDLWKMATPNDRASALAARFSENKRYL